MGQGRKRKAVSLLPIIFIHVKTGSPVRVEEKKKKKKLLKRREKKRGRGNR